MVTTWAKQVFYSRCYSQFLVRTTVEVFCSWLEIFHVTRGCTPLLICNESGWRNRAYLQRKRVTQSQFSKPGPSSEPMVARECLTVCAYSWVCSPLQICACVLPPDVFISNVFERFRVAHCLSVADEHGLEPRAANGPDDDRLPKMLESAFLLFASVLGIRTYIGWCCRSFGDRRLCVAFLQSVLAGNSSLNLVW